MRVAEPCLFGSPSEGASWKASLSLGFARQGARSVLSEREHDGPLVVQKPLYPEGPDVCHAIVVHPPGGIAGGDQLSLRAACDAGSHALLTTPGAGKWYRSAGPMARQSLEFDVGGTLEWLPRETIVFDGALATLETVVRLIGAGRFIGWEVVCLGRAGSGEHLRRGALKISTQVLKEERLLYVEKGEIDPAGPLMSSPVGLGGRTVLGTFIATGRDLAAPARTAAPSLAVTQLPELLVARYLGDSSEAALRGFAELWRAIRPIVAGREAVAPRIWST